MKVKVEVLLADGTWVHFGWVQQLTHTTTGPESTAIHVAADNMDILEEVWATAQPFGHWRLVEVK